MPLFASLTLAKETALTRGCFSKISVTDFVYRKLRQASKALSNERTDRQIDSFDKTEH